MNINNQKIQKDVYIKFNIPQKLKYKYLKENDKYSISKKTFSFEKKNGQVPVEHKYNINSSIWLITQLPKELKDKNVMKLELLSNTELTEFKFNTSLFNQNLNKNNKILKEFPLNEDELQDTIPIENENSDNSPSNEDELQDTVPIENEDIDILHNNEDELQDTVPIENEDIDILPNNEEEIQNTIPIENESINIIHNNEDEFQDTIPIENESIANNMNNLQNTIPYENEFQDTVPFYDNEYQNTIPFDYNELQNTNQFVNSNKSVSNKKSTFIKPNSILVNNSNENNIENTQPLELINEFSQISQTQNYEGSIIATQEYVDMDTQECVRNENGNDIPYGSNKNNNKCGKNEINDEIIAEASGSEYEDSFEYSISNIYNSSSTASTRYLKILNPLDYENINKKDNNDNIISNKRSFLQLDDYEEIIYNSDSYSSNKRKKLDDSNTDEIYALDSDIENEIINDKITKVRRTVSDITSSNKNKTKNNFENKFLSQENNPKTRHSHNKNTNEKVQEYIETQILSQNNNNFDCNENKLEATQKLPSQSQESIISSPPLNHQHLDAETPKSTQELILLSPTQKISSQELLSPKNYIMNESPKISSSVHSQSKAERNDSFIETQKITSQEILFDTQKIQLPEFDTNRDLDFDFGLDDASNTNSINSKNSLKSPNLISPDKNFANSKSPNLNFNHPTKINKQNIEILEKDRTPKHLINNTPESPDFFSPTLNMDTLPSTETQKIYSEESEILPLNQSFNLRKNIKNREGKNNIIVLDKDIDNGSYFSLNSKLNDNKDPSTDKKSLNQDIENIKLLPSQNDDLIFSPERSINNSQGSSNNPLFSPPLYQDNINSPEFNKEKDESNLIIAIDEDDKGADADTTRIYENNLKNNNDDKISGVDLLIKSPDLDFNKNITSPGYSFNDLVYNKDENCPKLTKTKSNNIFKENLSKSFIENETNEEIIINNFIENYLDRTNIFDNCSKILPIENILADLDKSNKQYNINIKVKGEENQLNSNQIINDNKNIFNSSPIHPIKPNDNSFFLLSEKEAKDDLDQDLSLSNKYNDGKSFKSYFSKKQVSSLSDTSGLIITSIKTPNNKFSNSSDNEVLDKNVVYTNHNRKNNLNAESSFIKIKNNSSEEGDIVSQESSSSFIANTPTPFKPKYINNNANNNKYIINNQSEEPNICNNDSNHTNQITSPKNIKDHSLNSLSFINVPDRSPGKLQIILSAKSSNPKDYEFPNSIPTTISSISSFEESPIDSDVCHPLILPTNIEIIKSLKLLNDQYQNDQKNLENGNLSFNSSVNSINISKVKKKYNFMGIIVQINNIETVYPRNKNKVINIFDSNEQSILISSVTISDSSYTFFPVIFWRSNSDWINRISTGDIILFVNFTLTKYRNKVMANTVGWGNNNYSSKFYIIKNINDKNAINLNVNPEIVQKVIDIQNWAKNDNFAKFLYKDKNQLNADVHVNNSTFLTIRQFPLYKNKCINIQGVPISIMKDVKISDDDKTYEIWKVEILDVDNEKVTLQINNLFVHPELLQYIHINEQKMYDFYDLIIHEETNKELVLYATKYSRIQTSNNIPTNIQNKLIEYTKKIIPKDFNSIEYLIKSRFNGLAKVNAFISKIIIKRTNNPNALEYPIITSSYKNNRNIDTIDDIVNTIQIYCNCCNEFLYQQETINITSLIDGIPYKDTIEQKIKYFIKFLTQKAFWPHCHHLEHLIYVYSPVELILQDTINDHHSHHYSQESLSSPLSSPSSSPLSNSSKFNSLHVYLDINSTKQFYDHNLEPELFIKIKGGLKRKGRIRSSSKIKDDINLIMIQRHLQKANPFTLSSTAYNEIEPIDDKFTSSPDFSSNTIDLQKSTIFNDIIEILSFKEDQSQNIDFSTNRSVIKWNQNLNKFFRRPKRKKNTFILSCNIQENEYKSNLYNVGPVYCKDFRNN
jgi:hypothetical protein